MKAGMTQRKRCGTMVGKWLVNLYEFFADAGEWLLSYLEPKAGFVRKPFSKWGDGND